MARVFFLCFSCCFGGGVVETTANSFRLRIRYPPAFLVLFVCENADCFPGALLMDEFGLELR